MARSNYAVEQGLDIFVENGDKQVSVITGSAAPGSAAQENNAPVGSIYLQTTGAFWQKTTAGSGTDKWTMTPTSALFTFRQEKAKTATNDAYPGNGSLVSAFSDNDGAFAAVNNTTFSPGDYIIFDADGTATLAIVSATSATDITVTTVGTTALVTGNVMVVSKYLPDAVGQEDAAIVFYTGSIIQKIGDVNWEFATGIRLSSGYTPGSGNPVANDTVEAAIQKIDGNVDAIDTREGLAQGAVNFGSFTAAGTHPLTTNATAKALFQFIENEIDTYKAAAGLTTVQTLDSVLVDNIPAVKWQIWASLDSSPAQVRMLEIVAIHDGTPSSDATVTDQSVSGIIRIGANFTVNINVDVSGVGAAQVLRLRIDAPAAVSVKTRRLEIK